MTPKKPRGKRIRYRLGEINSRILMGEEELLDWDDEELLRGKRRNKDGNFRGKAPQMVPMALYKELIRRRALHAAETLSASVPGVARTLVDIALGNIEATPEQLKACLEILNRNLGKSPERVELSVTEIKPWQAMVAEAIVTLRPDQYKELQSNDPDEEEVVEGNLLALPSASEEDPPPTYSRRPNSSVSRNLRSQ